VIERSKKVAVGFLLLALASAGAAKMVEESLELPVTATNMYGKTVSQPIKLTVFRDDERPRAPFLVLNHGRPAKPAEFEKMGRVRYPDNAKYFVAQGFAVFVPTRLGYGESGGEDMEYSGGCTAKNYSPAYEAAAQQSIKVIEYARSRSYVNPERGLLVGQSMGGAATVALAAKNPSGVVAAVNFAGGGGGDPAGRPGVPCRSDLMQKLYASYGATARVPVLWLYSENDKYWGKKLPHAWFNAFSKAGGPGEFSQLPPLPPELGDDGHASFTRNPRAWRPAFEEFLWKNGFSP
jgi:dienelactone hydrolase